MLHLNPRMLQPGTRRNAFPPGRAALRSGHSTGGGCRHCPRIEPAGQTDRQTDSQPWLCLCELSYHLLLGEGSSQLIQILPLRREGVRIAEQPITTSPAGVCAQQEEEFNRTGPTTAPVRQHHGNATDMGSRGAAGWGCTMVKDATPWPLPAHQSHTGACALARDQPVPVAPWGWGGGRE